MSNQICPMIVPANEGHTWCNPRLTIVASMDENIFGKGVNKQQENMSINTIHLTFYQCNTLICLHTTTCGTNNIIGHFLWIVKIVLVLGPQFRL